MSSGFPENPETVFIEKEAKRRIADFYRYRMIHLDNIPVLCFIKLEQIVTGKEEYNMDLEKIAGLVKIIEDSSLKEFTYKEGEVKITMSKRDHPPIVTAGMSSMPAMGVAPATIPLQIKTDEEEESLFITSPIVGTFYSAAAPDVPAFVRVGDRVKEGQTVCILEAMKLMNEIQCEYDCEIEAILVSNEQKVEYGQPLFRVKKI